MKRPNILNTKQLRLKFKNIRPIVSKRWRRLISFLMMVVLAFILVCGEEAPSGGGTDGTDSTGSPSGPSDPDGTASCKVDQ